jgi:hypothetical protein
MLPVNGVKQAPEHNFRFVLVTFFWWQVSLRCSLLLGLYWKWLSALQRNHDFYDATVNLVENSLAMVHL